MANAAAIGDVDRWALDGSVRWNPVSCFKITGDVGYADTDITGGTDTEERLFGVRMQRAFQSSGENQTVIL